VLLPVAQLPYSKFMHGLVQENIRVNRKVLLQPSFDCQAHDETLCKRWFGALLWIANYMTGAVGASEHGAMELQGPGRSGEVHAWPERTSYSSLTASQRQQRPLVMPWHISSTPVPQSP